MVAHFDPCRPSLTRMYLTAFSLLLALAKAEPPIQTEDHLFGLIKEEPEVNLNTEGIIKRWGYPVEKYDVTTEDGYILTIFRIPHGKEQKETPKGARPVVWFQHGVLVSSDVWVTNLPNQSAPFVYADMGYDVWLGNSRGNKYGRKHVTLSVDHDEEKFFDFSWPETSRYDLPATIDHILRVSQAPHVYYIGHSMGTLTMFVRLSQDKEFAKKVKRYYALGPIMKVQHVTGIIRTISPTVLDKMFSLARMHEFSPPSGLVKELGTFGCGAAGPLGKTICSIALFAVMGTSSTEMMADRIPVYVALAPDATSRRTVVHLFQMVKNGQIGQYDFGKTENMKRYGSETPPQYNISNIETPIAMYWGENDCLATDEDIRAMLPELKSVFSTTFLKGYNHADFVWGVRAPDEVYMPIKNDIQKDFEASRPGLVQKLTAFFSGQNGPVS